MANNVEKRFLTQGFEVRAEEGKPTVVEGYAAVFNDETVIGGSFAERIDRGAFKGADMNNTVALFNHDINKPLARAGHGLELTVDERGLKYRFEIGTQSYAQDLVENIRMGNVSTSSFGFTVKDDEWEMRDDINLRTIKEVGLLFDVSPTTQGAYPTTEVGLRSMELALENEGVLAAEEEAVRAYQTEDKEEEEDDEDEEEEEEVARSEKDKEEEEEDEDDSKMDRTEEVTLETADAPVAEDSEVNSKRGAESNISMNEEKNAPAVVQGLGDKVQNVRARFDLGKAIREAANGGLTGLEAEVSQEGTNEFRSGGVSPGSGINIPSMFLRTDAGPMGTVTNSTDLIAGGAIADELQGPIGRYRPVTFADKMGMRKITGVTGDIKLPVQTDSITVNEKTNENDAQSSANMAFSTVDLSPTRISSHTKASQMLLTQNSFDLQAFLADDMRRGLEQQYNVKIKGVIEGITEALGATNLGGSGTGGILTAADVPTYLESLLREADVDPAGAYILTDPTLYRALRRASLDAGSGLFAANDANTVGGYSSIVSTLFSDGNAYMVKPEDVVCAEWGGLNIMVDPYTEAHMDVVRIIANMYVDCKILRADGVVGVDLDADS
ncbi:MAG: hypothetical protein CMI60_08030 [Parvibaculum sp.]|nr:hypothetical protein [Parvibaculum sp.]